jgi:23S rRNA (cytidine1920-2'-O)/16S rRNA (cytidine1409-2'-O)-methyltransferase
VRAEDLPFRPALIVADLSFIPLELVLPALTAVSASPADLVLMVKPQFEVGRAAVGDGVVRDPALRVSAVRGVAEAAGELGLTVRDVAASPLPGPSGNVEYFLWLRRSGGRMGDEDAAGLVGEDLEVAITRAVSEGPQ